MTKKRADDVQRRIDAVIRDSYRVQTPADAHQPDSTGQSADWPKVTDDTRNHPPPQEKPR